MTSPYSKTILSGIALFFLLVSTPLSVFADADFNAKFFVTADNVLRPSVSASESSGALIHTIPLSIPPGRNGLQPEVALEYNNQRNNNTNIVGYGWDIPIPSIERVNKTGTENLYTARHFTSSFDGELAFVASTTVTEDYGPRFSNERSYDYTFFDTDDAWQAVDAFGTIYTFGSTTAARQSNPADSTKIFKWMLQEVRDKNNNYITYTYTKDNGQIYPATITYTGNGTTAGDFEISFGTESRLDYLASYNAAFSVESRYRINQILVKIDGVWVRKYDLAYTTGVNGSRSLLSSITETGKDKDGNTVVLPAISFTYESTSPTWTIDAAWDAPTDFIRTVNGGDVGVRFAEMNGDGLIDIVKSHGPTTGACDQQATYFNIGAGWANSGHNIPECFAIPNAGLDDTGARMGDFNGDGITDLAKVRYNSGEASTTENFYLNLYNKGLGFEDHNIWNAPGYFYSTGSGYSDAFLLDANTDGQEDFILSGGVYLFSATTTGWDADANLYGGIGTQSQDPGGQTLVDLNSDGLIDRIVAAYDDSPSENVKKAYVNNGTGFTEVSSSTIPVYFYENGSTDLGVRVTDVNNDGLPDIIKGHKTLGGSSVYEVYKNVSTSSPNWIYDSALSSALPDIYFTHYYNSINRDGGWRATDANGDGLTDFVGTYYYADPSGEIRVETYINDGNRNDILTQVTTAQGGTISFTYKSSVEYKDGGGHVLNTEMPAPIQTVQTITRNDGFGTPTTETREYAGAFYYFSGADDRQFAGFHIATSTDGAGTKTITYFHQGTTTNSVLGEYDDHIAKAGKPYRIEVKNSAGALMKKTINKWDRYEEGQGRNFVKLIQSITFDYDGDSDHKDMAETYVYNNTSRNLSQKSLWGEVVGADAGTFTDSGTDKSVFSYAYATSTDITGLPYEEMLTNYASTTLSQKLFYYDSLGLGSVQKGNQTKREEWETGSTYIDFEKTFNTYGLVTEEKDPRDKATTFVYEAKNIHVATTTNPDGHITERYLDYSSGKVQKFVDPNGRSFETTFDGLDRVTVEKIPDVASPSSLVNKKTIAYTDTVGSRKTLETNYLNSATSTELYTYLDGFDRKLQTRKEAEDGNTYAVRDFEYNLVGLLKRESLPYFGIGSSRAASTSDSTFYTTYTYDALKRSTNELNAVGSTTRAYDDWTTTVIDALNNTKQFTNDAFGNLKTVIEHDDGSQYTTTYEYNARNDLTKITDSLGNLRNFTYDNLSRLTKSEDLHDAADTGFASTTLLYDAAGNVTTKIDGKNQTVNFTYDDINRVLTENYTLEAGTEVAFAYDTCPEGIGRLCSATTTAAAANFVYDALGNIASEEKTINSTRYLTSFAYDRQGNMTSIVYPDAATASYRFNAAGLLESVDLLPTSTSTLSRFVLHNANYNPGESVTARHFGNGDTSLYDYDEHALYRLSTITTLVGTTTPFSGKNPVLTMGSTNVQQDGADLVGNLINLMGTATTSTVTVGFRYGLLLDNDDPWTATTTTMAATSTGPFSISLLGLQDFKDYSFQAFMSTSSTAVYYGDRYRFYTGDLTMSMPTYKGDQRAWPLRTYDADGTHASTTVGGPSLATTTPAKYLKLYNFGSTSTPQYQAGYWISDPWDLSPITNVEDSFIEYCVCARNGADVKVKTLITSSTTTPAASDFTTAIATSTTSIPGVTAGSNLYGKFLWLKVELTPSYSATGTPCLCRINVAINNVGTTTAAHNALQALTYTYDTAGNITQVKDLSGFGGGKVVNYTYDDLYRLLTASTTVPVDGGYRQTFTYDRIGNIATTSRLGDYTYAETNYANPHAATSIGGVSVTYDNNGNVIFFGSDIYGWNYRDRMASSTVGGITTFYGYDFQNDRVTKGNGTATTTYVGSYYTVASATTTKHIFDTSGTLLATVEGNGTATSTNFSHADHLNSTTITTDEDGDVTQALDYYPYGSERVSTGSNATDRHYIGERFDTETSLNYLNARYYQNSRGQFMSQDPVARDVAMMKPMLEYILTVNKKPGEINREAVLSNPQLLNSYSYSGNNPITMSDPSGEVVAQIAQRVLQFLLSPATREAARKIISGTSNLLTVKDVVEGYKSDFDDNSKGVLGLDAAVEFAKTQVNKYQRTLFDVGQILISVFEGQVQIPQQAPMTDPTKQTYTTPSGAVVDWHGNIITAPSSDNNEDNEEE
ncbi:MAG: VCBS repeat-containing protein [Parcubacteria group bacterium]|nr:VCBS repeat-containing protein [Parcubacteria group bacterium]